MGAQTGAAGSRAAAAAESSRIRRYREAEHRLWQHYGIEPRERFVEIRSPVTGRLRVAEVGSGEPVLFVHGTGGIGPYWGPLIRELDGYRFLILDRPGWGLSSAVDFTRHDYRTLTGDLLAAVLDGLGLKRVHVVGASIGDVWALRLAQRYPGMVERVVLLGGGPLLQDVPVPKIIRLIRSPIGALMVRLPEKPARVRSILRAIGHGSSLDAGHIPDEYVGWRVSLSRNTDSMRNERNMVRAIVGRHGFQPSLTFQTSELAGIHHPTLLVYGRSDPTGPIEVWERFTRLMPQAQLHLIDGGHMPWLDDPREIAAVVQRFLRGPRPHA